MVWYENCMTSLRFHTFLTALIRPANGRPWPKSGSDARSPAKMAPEKGGRGLADVTLEAAALKKLPCQKAWKAKLFYYFNFSSNILSYCYALGHTMPAFSLFYSAFCLFSRSFSPHIMQFAYLEQNAECNGMTQKLENEAIWPIIK